MPKLSVRCSGWVRHGQTTDQATSKFRKTWVSFVECECPKTNYLHDIQSWQSWQYRRKVGGVDHRTRNTLHLTVLSNIIGLENLSRFLASVWDSPEIPWRIINVADFLDSSALNHQAAWYWGSRIVRVSHLMWFRCTIAFYLHFYRKQKLRIFCLQNGGKAEIKSHEEMSRNCWQYSSGRKAQGVMLFLCMVICCMSYKLCGP